jgi:hypothetical protein
MRFLDEQGRAYAYLDSGKLVLTDEALGWFKRHPRLDLSGSKDLAELPEGLRLQRPILRECTGLTRLPAGLDVRILSLAGCTKITELPSGLTCDQLNLQRTSVRALPAGLQRYRQSSHSVLTLGFAAMGAILGYSHAVRRNRAVAAAE